jgi:hypothetical protein
VQLHTRQPYEQRVQLALANISATTTLWELRLRLRLRPRLRPRPRPRPWLRLCLLPPPHRLAAWIKPSFRPVAMVDLRISAEPWWWLWLWVARPVICSLIVDPDRLQRDRERERVCVYSHEFRVRYTHMAVAHELHRPSRASTVSCSLPHGDQTLLRWLRWLRWLRLRLHSSQPRLLAPTTVRQLPRLESRNGPTQRAADDPQALRRIACRQHDMPHLRYGQGLDLRAISSRVVQ